MMDAAERLRTARKQAGYANASDAAEAFGWKGSTYLGHENGSRGLRPDAAERYARAFGVRAEWLLFGTGGVPVRVDRDDPMPTGAALVSVFDVQASAGPGAVVDDYEAVTHSLAFPPDYLCKLTRSHPRNLAIISVKGDSMDPTLRDDDIVMLDMSKTNLSYDGLFVLRFGDALHVKRVARCPEPGHITIVSDNPRVPPQNYPLDEITVIGKVIWGGGKM